MTLLLRKWTIPIARRLTLRRLDKIERAAIDIGSLWSDEDQSIVNLADELVDQVREFRKQLDDNIAARRLEREHGS